MTVKVVHRPIQAGIGVRLQELDAQRRIAEQHQSGKPDRQAGVGAEPALIDGVEELHTLAGHGGLQPRDSLVENMRALHTQDAVGRGHGRRAWHVDRGGGGSARHQGHNGEGRERGAKAGGAAEDGGG